MSANPFSSLQDAELIEACLNGKEPAWEVLLTRFQRLIYSIPLRYGLTEADANDVFQNVSVLLLENLHGLRDRQRLGAWLIITTRRECWRLVHKRRQSASDEIGAMDDRPADLTSSEENFSLLERQSIFRSALDQLESPCQELLKLLFYSEPKATYADISEKLSIPTGSIGPNRARCLEKMLKILETMGYSEM